MPLASKQGSEAQSGHRSTLVLSEWLSRLQNLCTATGLDAFGQLLGVVGFVNLCTKEGGSRTVLDEVWPGICQASARALQLLYSSGSFQQQSDYVRQGIYGLLWSMQACMGAVLADSKSSQPQDHKLRLKRLLVSCTTAGGCTISSPQ